MKLLKDILYKVPLLDTLGNTHLAVSRLAFDSRKVVKDTLFVAIKGTQTNGHDYIDQAVAQGAHAIVCEDLPEKQAEGVTYLKVKNSARALGIIAANFYDHPSSKLSLVAVTGTNGKTTVTTLCHRLFQALGEKAGLISTVNVMVGKESHPATHTTPDPISINRYLQQMVKAGVKYCFMEASSHGIVQERTAGLDFAGAVFTNITHEHLDYHGTFDDYILAKKKLFDELPKKAFALSNGDDRHGSTMMQHTKASVHYYALKTDAPFKAKVLEHQLNGMLLKLGEHEVWTKLIGHFNAYNLLAVYAVGRLLKQDSLQVATAISSLRAVDGRFEYIQSKDGITVIVDYAHSPDALENVLNTIAQVRKGTEKVITVVGCGGNRDREKRPVMARLAVEKSDQAIFTSDNPRDEDPEAIIAEMEAGLQPPFDRKYLSIASRREAIKTAIQLAQGGDIILIAGKGHEKFQLIKGEKLPFDDLAIAHELLNPPQE